MNDVNMKYQDIDLPGEWVWCSLGEIAAAQPGFACGNKNVQDGLIHLRMNNISDDCSLNMDLIRKVPLDYKIEKYLLKTGDLLFCHTNSSKLVGKNAIFNLNGDYAYSNHLTRLRVDPSIISTKWLWCILTVYWKEGRFENECKNWVNQSTLPHDKLVQLSIPIPPILEQHLIVDRVETLLERVKKAKESLEKIPRTLKRFRQAALKKAFSGELTTEWREQQQNLEPAAELLKRIQEEQESFYQTKAERQKQSKRSVKPENEPLDTSDLPELPEGWCWATLPQLGELARGKSKHRPRDDVRLFGGPYPFIQTGDVKNSNGKIEKFTQTYSEFGLAQSRLWPAGTLCITIAANIADSGILTFPSCFPDSVVGFISEDTFSDVRFIEFFMRTAKKDLEKYAPATAQKNINLDTLQKLAVPLPPLSEQQEIVRRIESLFKFADETEKKAKEARRRVEMMTQSILSRAFRGDLTADFREAVKNWKDLDAEARRRYIFVLPEDEREKILNAYEFPMAPASELLRRIGEERAKMERRSTKTGGLRAKRSNAIQNCEN